MAAPLEGSVEIEHVEQIANSRHIHRYIRMVGIQMSAVGLGRPFCGGHGGARCFGSPVPHHQMDQVGTDELLTLRG